MRSKGNKSNKLFNMRGGGWKNWEGTIVLVVLIVILIAVSSNYYNESKKHEHTKPDTKDYTTDTDGSYNNDISKWNNTKSNYNTTWKLTGILLAIILYALSWIGSIVLYIRNHKLISVVLCLLLIIVPAVLFIHFL